MREIVMFSMSLSSIVLLYAALVAEVTQVEGRQMGDSGQVSCRNPQGQTVEWFIIYKVPKKAENKLDRPSKGEGLKGSEFGYYDSTMGNKKAFDDGADGVSVEKNNPLAISLQQIFNKNKSEAQKNLTYVVYNDQPPPESGTASTESGHTKGVVVFGKQTGLWLVHSVPHFPGDLFSGRYSYPESGYTNGQTAMCVTLKANQLNTVASHLRRQQPHLYEASAPESVRNQNPELSKLLKKNFAYETLQDEFVGIKGTKFTSFAKSGRQEKDVYGEVIAPALKTDLYVESWRNGNGGKLPPQCETDYKVLNIERVSIGIGNRTLHWLSTEDHSKWALGETNNWICIGSINRMHSQFKRGGETLCIQNPTMHGILKRGIADFEPCPTH